MKGNVKMIHKKFMDIQRIKPEYADGFNVGDYIVIQEKIDGCNAAIRYDTENDTIVAQSRKNILGIGNNLRGFYEWSQTLNKELVKSVLNGNLVLFMEWLVPHTLSYPKERYNHAYCYDVYDTNTEKYLPQSTVQAIVSKLNLTYVPTFYEGKFISWEHCVSFVGKTELGGEQGEGCFKGDTKILMSDGTMKYIKDIQIGDIVKSYNTKTKEIEDKKVINIFFNGHKPIEEWLNLAVFPRGISSRGLISGKFLTTKNHRFYNGVGWCPIEKLSSIYHYGKVFDKFRKQAFLGLLSSDAHLSRKIFSISQATKKISDFRKLFKEFISSESNLISGKGSDITVLNFQLQATIELYNAYTENDRIDYIKVFNDYDDISWAFFFMGDGYASEYGSIELCLASYSTEECLMIQHIFENHFKIDTKLTYDTRVTSGSGGRLRTSNSNGRKILKRLAKYIMPNYRYKLAGIKDMDVDDFIGIPCIEYGITKRELYTKIPASKLSTWVGHKTIAAYDIEVEDNHNYFANGCLVHNCVVKNQTMLNNPNTRQPFYIKIVAEKFQEIHTHKEAKVVDPATMKKREEVQKLAETIVTEARVRKLLNKFVDEDILPEDWSLEEMPIIAKNLTKAVYEDCVKEEPETVKQIDNFGKVANGIAMKLARNIASER